jgi:hypothetical protein
MGVTVEDSTLAPFSTVNWLVEVLCGEIEDVWESQVVKMSHKRKILHSLIVEEERNTDLRPVWPLWIQRVLAVTFEITGEFISRVCDRHGG